MSKPDKNETQPKEKTEPVKPQRPKIKIVMETATRVKSITGDKPKDSKQD
jgi:hypothetical protein